MTRILTQALAQQSQVRRYRGHVTYLYAFDVAYEIDRRPITSVLGQPVTPLSVDTNKRAPRQLFSYRPLTVKLPPIQRLCPGGPAQVDRQVKIFSVGGPSITVRVPFDVSSIAELVQYHDLCFKPGPYSPAASLHDEVLALAEQVREDIKSHLIRPVEKLAPDEAYTVFAITSPLDTPEGTHVPAEDWFEANRRQVAALLTEETNTAHLSDQEADESTSRYLSYYDHDMVVVDWDAALIVDESRYIDEMVYLMELANLQLAELEAYDRLLDNVIDRSYRDLSSNGGLTGIRQWSGRTTLKELRELRIDLARLSDELQNITKFFGDWHLARIYQALASRFHLADWHKTTDEKLKTLDDLYQLLQADRNHRTMLILEVTIVLLFILDVVIIFVK